MAFTDFGIKTLTGLIEIYKADPDLLKSNAQPTQTDDPAAHAACLLSDSSPQSISIDQSLPAFSTALSVRLCQPPAFPPFSMAKSGPAVQVG
jgi:hypothetical protein